MLHYSETLALEKFFSQSSLVCFKYTKKPLERALRIVYNDNVFSFKDLLQRDQSVTIHHRNIQFLAIERYKARHDISSHIMEKLFKQQNILYNLCSETDFTTGSIGTVNNGLKSLRYLGPEIWNIIPPDIRNSGNIEEFTRKIKR